MKILKGKLVIFYITVFILFCGCVGMVEKTGKMLDGSAFEEKTIALYRTLEKDGAPADMEIALVENKENERSIVFTILKYPASIKQKDFPLSLKFRGTLPDDEGAFSLTSLEYLAGSTHGWNEYTLHIIGSGILSLEEKAVLAQITEIEAAQITKGRIHRYDTRITGNEALTALRNRRERIRALAEWMHSVDAPKGQSIKDFEKYWKPVFFPETVSGKKKPANWRRKDDKFQRAESIRWNTSYTERVFSEELWPVRNSGTLLRDWEEALPWIYIEYEWENLINLFSGEIIFNKIK